MSEQDPPPDPVALIEAIDPAIFTIESQTSERDRVALLIAQRFLRHRGGPYRYLEIGSHLGGTLIPYLLDGVCELVVSVDVRPMSQPDQRGRSYPYEENSTARMIDGLRHVVRESDLGKLETYDCDISALSVSRLEGTIDCALIDGEHTNTAAFSDFLGVLPYMAPNSVVCFHDANVVIDAILNIERLLDHLRIPVGTCFLRDCVAIMALGEFNQPFSREVAGAMLDRERYISYSRQSLRDSISRSATSDAC